MKKTQLFFVLMITFILQSCIGEDIIQDEIPAEIRFLNAIERIEIDEVYELNILFLNSIGNQEIVDVNWFSDNSSIAVVDEDGTITGVSEGEVSITAETIIDGAVIENTIVINVVGIDSIDVAEPEVRVKNGTIITTSSYVLQGGFALSEIENTNNIELSIENNYRASTSLPGLYVYLSNNPNSIGNALEIGAVETFNGAHTYIINNAGINDYAYVLYWCKPFGVKVGEGEINN